MKTRIQTFILAVLAVTGLSLASNYFLQQASAAPVVPVVEPVACTFTVSPLTKTVAAAANSFQLNVDVSNIGCAWTATTPATWLHIVPAAGLTSTVVTVIVDANHSPQRLDNITIAGKVVTVTQVGGCGFTISPPSKDFSAAGGNGTTYVTASHILCQWTASENAAWIQVAQGSTSGQGNGTINYTVSSNNGPARSAVINIGGNAYTVNQAAGCTFTAAPNDFTFTEAGGGNQVNMQPSNAACTFNANSLVPWVHIGASANGKFNFTVDANPGPARDGLISAGFNSIAIHQRSGCDYTFSPASQSLPATSGIGSFTVTTTSNMCKWHADSNAAWLHIPNHPDIAGDKQMAYTYDANPGAQRTAIITAGGKQMTVTQAGGCVLTVNQNSQSFPANGDTGAVNVSSTGSDCPWTASSNDAWITVGNGPGVQKYLGSVNVPVTVAPNNGPARTGTITVAGKNIIIGQAAGCSFTINPASQAFPATGGDGVVNVTASNAACPYFINNPPAWVIVTNGANGIGNGVVKYTVAANNGAARSGQMDVAGKTLALTQETANAKPAPVIANLSPGFTALGSKDFALKVTGINFNNNCRVRWNGQERPTNYISNGELLATIPASDLMAEGAAAVTVLDLNANAFSNEKAFMVYGPLANVSAASFTGETLAPASMVAAFGNDLATQVMAANKVPLPTELAGTVVTVQDALGQLHQAPLFFVSGNQVNYLIPEKVALGPALVMIQSGSKHISVQFVQIAPVAPALFTANANGAGIATGLVLRVKANGQQVYETFAQLDPQTKKFVAKPIDVSDASEAVYLVLYGTGFRYRSKIEAVTVEIGGVQLNADFAGKVGGLEGLDQLNVLAPQSLAGRGEVEVLLTVDGKKANPVKLMFK
ncbi:MAG: hypothetical protein HYR56_24820 [Acidobacteria bacterium]|nr:hypothetical protein [Acidobacteriota bacterium]MBI3428136.1 hypothetical protein [Acidobacteriota bacterium]